MGRQAIGSLAARGAGSPEAFAAFLAGRAHSGGRTLSFAGGNMDNLGNDMSCPRCGYSGSSESFGGGAGGTSDTDKSPEALRTPAPDTGYVRNGAPLAVRGGGSAPGLASQLTGLELATPRYPVSTPDDVMIRRSATGSAEIRHRRGGTLIGEIMRGEQGWQASSGGRTSRPHSHQRGALQELLSEWNTGTTTIERPAAPLQPPLHQTDLMAQYGIPAIRALATPATSASSGARTTTMAGGGDDDDPDDGKSSGLTPKGVGIKKKLLAKGWTDAKADMFAKRAQSFGGNKSS